MALFEKRPRKGQVEEKLPREEFRKRFLEMFVDPAFERERDAITRLEHIAHDAYAAGRKAPLTEKAGEGFADPDYDLSSEWLKTCHSLRRAAERQRDPTQPARALVICGSDRNDGTCPGEMSKTYRLAQAIVDSLRHEQIPEVDLLDLSRMTSEYGRTIHPCKGCVSTAMPLCHWPCSCYPNHSLGQIHDWMGEIYERWALAHGVVIVTPVYWYQAPSALKLMIDRLVCADGGNPDPTSTHGKDAARAKHIELSGWNYPQHLRGRVYGLLVHGDVAGIENTRRALSDWLDWMGLIDAGAMARLDRYIGYYQPYATSHDALDRDQPLWKEATNIGLAVANAIQALRAGTLSVPDAQLERPRPK